MGGVSDVLDHGVEAIEGFAPPVDANGTEPLMLNRVPLTRAGRIRADVDLQACGIRQGLPLDFIKTTDGRVTAATVAGNI